MIPDAFTLKRQAAYIFVLYVFGTAASFAHSLLMNILVAAHEATLN